MRERYNNLKTAYEKDRYIRRFASTSKFCSSGLGPCVIDPRSKNPCGGTVAGCIREAKKERDKRSNWSPMIVIDEASMLDLTQLNLIFNPTTTLKKI